MGHQEYDNRGTSIGSILTGFVIGGLVGAAAALLMAPQSGEKTRMMLRDKGYELMDEAEHTMEQARSQAEEAIDRARGKAKQTVSESRSRAESGLERAQHRTEEMIDRSAEEAKNQTRRM